MITTYVIGQSGLTAMAGAFVKLPYEVYRTRINCACTVGSPRRHGILIVDGEKVVAKIIMCRRCAAIGKGAGHE